MHDSRGYRLCAIRQSRQKKLNRRSFIDKCIKQMKELSEIELNTKQELSEKQEQEQPLFSILGVSYYKIIDFDDFSKKMTFSGYSGKTRFLRFLTIFGLWTPPWGGYPPPPPENGILPLYKRLFVYLFPAPPLNPESGGRENKYLRLIAPLGRGACKPFFENLSRWNENFFFLARGYGIAGSPYSKQ